MNCLDDVVARITRGIDNLGDNGLRLIPVNAGFGSYGYFDDVPSRSYLAMWSGTGWRGRPAWNSVIIDPKIDEELVRLVGLADANKFRQAIEKGLAGSTLGAGGIKRLTPPVGIYTYELKITGSSQRLVGYINDQGVLIFDKFTRGGYHK